MAQKKPWIVTVTNEKGGIGKTTTVINMAAVLENMGYKTLVIDTDRQANATDTYNAQMEGEATIYDAVLESEENKIPLDEAIQHTDLGDIVASDKLLKSAEAVISADANGNYRLLEAIESSKTLDQYDYILIDTAPAINKMLYNCLIASDEVIIPVLASRYSLEGLADLAETISEVQKRQNRDLKIAGLLITMYNDKANIKKAGKEVLEERAEALGTKVFKNYIRTTVKVDEAVALRTSIVKYALNSTVGQDYYNFVEEYLEDHGKN